ncbi:hypothetical protein BJ875DRAFT_487558 [Amylocarpus encephaloides]|uniref:Uncharacterized protein n=1 Tax=Amylocarpus encephaloides TaxID=45428 RepID=A0A9P7YD55_9HELO|nr:hypothetical protein BJ875DRAFT_487558 [Amylocarpus encephaloides]
MSSVGVYPYPYQTSGHGHTIRDPILFDTSSEGFPVDSGLDGSRLRHPNARKRVHWASEVIYIDRSEATGPQTHAGRSRPPPTEQSSSRDLSSRLLPSTSTGFVARARHGDVGLVGPSAMPSLANTSKLMARRRGRSLDETNDARRGRSRSSAPLDGHVISMPKGDSSRRGKRIGVAANSSFKRDSRILPNHPVFIVDVLPAVPDPPPNRLPPAPRPARLPTPDLDDISNRNFCSCDDLLCRFPTHQEFSAAFSKTNHQLEAAKAHIKNGRD